MTFGFELIALFRKTAAKNLLAKELPSVPLVPGYNGADQDVETLIAEAKKIGKIKTRLIWYDFQRVISFL